MQRRAQDQFQRVFIFGGQSDTGFERDVHVLNVSLSHENGLVRVESRRLADMPGPASARAGHCAVAVDDSVVVFGGMGVGQLVMNDVHVYDAIKDEWTLPRVAGTAPRGRWCHSSHLVERDLLVFGGWVYVTGMGQRHTFLNDLHVLNVDTMVWSEVDTVGAVPRALCQAPCFHVPRCVCVCDLMNFKQYVVNGW